MKDEHLPYPPLAPYIAVTNAAEAIAFYQEAFGAVERLRLTDPGSAKIGHAELTIGDALFMLSDEFPTHGQAPSTLGGHTGRLCLIVEDVDRAVERAVAAGAEVTSAAADHFYGFRSATLRDPSGHEWNLQHQIEEISGAEMQSRWDKMLKG